MRGRLRALVVAGCLAAVTAGPMLGLGSQVRVAASASPTASVTPAADGPAAYTATKHLTRSFRRYLGATPTAFINAKRLGLAAELLLTTETPVIDVGGLCGFNSQSRFYRLFTESFGCPPKAFRETFRNQPEPPSPFTS